MTLVWGAYWIGVTGFGWVVVSLTRGAMRSRRRAGRPAVTVRGAAVVAATAAAVPLWPLVVPVALVWLRDPAPSSSNAPNQDERI